MALEYQHGTQADYYKSARRGSNSEFGSYQFITLDDIVTQFQIAYVGMDKIIHKVKRQDIVFHAQRAIQELSFDTFKSFKSQQIDLADTLQMILPHDYVNYTKISWTDSSGIKHPMYPTKHTSNPFEIRQDDDNNYWFESGENLVINGSFDSVIFGQGNWLKGTPLKSSIWNSIETYGSNNSQRPIYLYDHINRTNDDELRFRHRAIYGHGIVTGRAYGVFQKIDTRDVRFLNLQATGTSMTQQTAVTAGDIAGFGVIRIGFTTTNPATGLKPNGSIGWDKGDGTPLTAHNSHPTNPNAPSPNYVADNIDLGYVEWNDGTTSEKELEDIDVRPYDEVWVYIQSHVPFNELAYTAPSGAGTASCTPTSSVYTNSSVNLMDNVVVTSSEEPNSLMPANADNNSSTWSNYKSTTPPENNKDDYEDDTYWPNNGERYGLDSTQSQLNGSFFIDDLRGLIHFSSNISGKTIILDYISDGLGTDNEMVVHKFAEEAMYKSIAYAILSTSALANRAPHIINRFKRERFAAIRNAKLRLSNFKLEELTQILRGKSKHIKH